jgi:phytol kinase
MLSNNLFAFVITLAVAVAWLRLNDFAAHRGWVSSRLSRKIIHMGTGPLFVLCWPLFTSSPLSRYIAALVPLAITIQFILVGLGTIRDDGAVQAMTRTGDRREILRGPLYYGIVFVIMTILYWYDRPTGIIALMLMCGGDGLADILGRRYGKLKLPWVQVNLGWVARYVLGGWTFLLRLLGLYRLSIIQAPLVRTYFPSPNCLAGTAVESLPFQDVDNITVTLTAVVIGSLFAINLIRH